MSSVTNNHDEVFFFKKTFYLIRNISVMLIRYYLFVILDSYDCTKNIFYQSNIVYFIVHIVFFYKMKLTACFNST